MWEPRGDTTQPQVGVRAVTADGKDVVFGQCGVPALGSGFIAGEQSLDSIDFSVHMPQFLIQMFLKADLPSPSFHSTDGFLLANRLCLCRRDCTCLRTAENAIS